MNEQLQDTALLNRKLDLPEALVRQCHLFIWACHETHGPVKTESIRRYVDSDEKGYALGHIAGIHNYASVIRLTVWLWLACRILHPIIILSAFFFGWRVLLGLILSITGDILLSRLERKTWIILSAHLLAFDILAQNFAGWGIAYPEQRRQALSIAQAAGHSSPSTSLDDYLPRWREFSLNDVPEFLRPKSAANC